MTLTNLQKIKKVTKNEKLDSLVRKKHKKKMHKVLRKEEFLF